MDIMQNGFARIEPHSIDHPQSDNQRGAIFERSR
jgi:hypothetical protein